MLAPTNQYGGLHSDLKDNVGVEIDFSDPSVKWNLKMTRPGGGNLQTDPVTKVNEVEDLLLILDYQWE